MMLGKFEIEISRWLALEAADLAYQSTAPLFKWLTKTQNGRKLV
jgi:hypothetical protein